jgi:hypothetical protein
MDATTPATPATNCLLQSFSIIETPISSFKITVHHTNLNKSQFYISGPVPFSSGQLRTTLPTHVLSWQGDASLQAAPAFMASSR